MIRWRFVISRLFVLAAIVYLLGLGLGPVAQYLTQFGLESTLGSRVEIADTDVGFFPPRVKFFGIDVADPRQDKSSKNAISADSVELVIDSDALLHRRWVASSGRITGLEIGSQRDTSGHFDVEVAASPSDEPSMLTQWLGSATGALQGNLKQFGGDLETVRRSREIRASWQRQYDQAIADAKDVQQRIIKLRDQARSIDNPLRDWDELRQALADADQTRSRLIEVRQTINALPEKFQSDFASMEDAKQIDLEKVDAYVPGDLAGTDKLGVDLVREAIAEQVKQVRGYIEGGKAVAGYTVSAPENEDRHRGKNYDLLNHPRPEFLVRRCEVAGRFSNNGDQYAISGIIDNLTPDPELLEQPTRARLRLEGPDVLRLDYVRDRRRGVQHDRVTLHWPDMDAGEMQLGQSAGSRIEVIGGSRELWVQLDLSGDQVDGRLVSNQTGVEMNLQLDGDLSESVAAKSLASSLSSIDRIEINADFGGTWDKLDIDLQTNLGRALRLAAKQAIDGQIAASKLDLADRIAKVQAEETMRLQDWITSHQGQAQGLLTQADQTVESVRQKIVSQIGDVDYIGRLHDAVKRF